MTTLQEIIARDNPALLSRLARRIDIAAEWPDLDDDERDWLVDHEFVGTVDATASIADVESWKGDWRPESNAAWPTYDVTMSAPGMADMELTGWHAVGPMGPDGNRQSEEWCQEDDDGQFNGLPRVALDRRRSWVIESGDNVGESHDIPCWLHDGRLVTLDREQVNDVLESAAGLADHGDEPTYEDVDREDMDHDHTRYIIHDDRVVEVDVLTGGVAGHDTFDGERDVTEYYATAWSHSLTEDVFADEDDALSDLRGRSQTGKAYRSEQEAIAALCELATDRHGVADGMETCTDDDGWYVRPEDCDDAGMRYHPTADEAADLLVGGWATLTDTLVKAFGLRNCLDLARGWRATADEAIESRDPFVAVADSIAAGNCPQGTDQFRRRLCEHLHADGEVGAVRASVILSLRDDTYTRRACRVAAMRACRTAK